MPSLYYLVDFENVQPKALGRLVPGQARVKVFLGQNQSKIPLDLVLALQPFGMDAEHIQIEGSGPDAVDFHIAYYIGRIAALEPDAAFRIISRDKGFDPLVRHLVRAGIDVSRLLEIPVPPTPAPAPAPTHAATPKAGKPATAAAGAAPKAATTAAVTTKARAKEAVARLKKSTRPAKLSTLKTSLMSWYGAAWGEASVAAVLQSLLASKVVVVSGTKVTYNLA